MTIVGLNFTANLNADKIYIDLTYLPDPVKHKFWLTIQNQSLSTLYFKIICNISNWSLDTPSDGKLGSVNASSTKTFTITISRSKPSSETVDTGNFTIEAYTDSAYTNKIGETSLNVTVYIEDLESWTDVDKTDFDDGTPQGWTLSSNMSISSDESVEAGGYSARFHITIPNGDAYISKSINIPNRNNVRLSFFIALKMKGLDSHSEVEINNIYVSLDETKIFEIPFQILYVTGTSTVIKGWLKFTLDLSSYKGETKTVKIGVHPNWINTKITDVYIWFDHIVIAGKD